MCVKSILPEDIPVYHAVAVSALFVSPRPDITAEQEARDLLERIGVERPDPQSFTSGDLVELANLLASSRVATTPTPVRFIGGHDCADQMRCTICSPAAGAPDEATPLTDEQAQSGLQEARRIITNGDGYDFGGLRVPFAPEFKSLALRAIAQTAARVSQLEATVAELRKELQATDIIAEHRRIRSDELDVALRAARLSAEQERDNALDVLSGIVNAHEASIPSSDEADDRVFMDGGWYHAAAEMVRAWEAKRPERASSLNVPGSSQDVAVQALTPPPSGSVAP